MTLPVAASRPGAPGVPALVAGLQHDLHDWLPPCLAMAADGLERARQQVMVHEVNNQLAVAQKRQRRHQDAPGYFSRREVDETRIEIESLERRLVDLKASISGREVLTSPVTGVIATSAVVAGQVVDAISRCFSSWKSAVRQLQCDSDRKVIIVFGMGATATTTRPGRGTTASAITCS